MSKKQACPGLIDDYQTYLASTRLHPLTYDLFSLAALRIEGIKRFFLSTVQSKVSNPMAETLNPPLFIILLVTTARDHE